MTSPTQPPPAFARCDPALLAALRQHSAAVVGDAMDRFGALDSRIQATWPAGTVAGNAYTVWTRAGDNLMIHQALDLIEPGDMLVVNGYGDETRALIGEMIGIKAKTRGLVGFVLDGAARDIADLQALGVPAFARAVTPAGPYKNGPGHLGLPVAVGGVCVHPGDAVLGDGDGVVVVPRAQLRETLVRADEIVENEKRKRVQNAVPIR